MPAKLLLRTAIISFLVFSSIVCKKDNHPVEAENTDPVIITDAWEKLPDPPGGMVWVMKAGDDGALYAGIESGLARSTDSGLSWEQVYSSTPNVIYFSPYDGMIILSLTGSFNTTTCYSTDNGVTWKCSEKQPASSSISHYISLPEGELFAGGFIHDESSGGLFISSDKGVSWNRLPDIMQQPSVASLALNPANHVYALLTSGFSFSNASIYCSTDKGNSWSKIQKPDSLYVRDLVITRSNGLIVCNYKDILISEDNGENWRSLAFPDKDGMITDIEIDSDDNLLVTFLGPDNTTKVFLYSGVRKKWYIIEGIKSSSYERMSTIVGKDRHIYLATFDEGVYKTRQSIDSYQGK